MSIFRSTRWIIQRNLTVSTSGKRNGDSAVKLLQNDDGRLVYLPFPLSLRMSVKVLVPGDFAYRKRSNPRCIVEQH